jgi:hypothetical protein
MWRVEPRKRKYPNRIEIDDQPKAWIREHTGLADRSWLISQVTYGEWVSDNRGSDYFLIYAKEFEGRKSVTILIRVREFSTHVLVYHVHVLRKKE